MIDHFLDDLDDFDSLFGPLLTFHLERAALRLVQNVGTEERGEVVRIHLVAWQLCHARTSQHRNCNNTVKEN